jgi:hypothetical protein
MMVGVATTAMMVGVADTTAGMGGTSTAKVSSPVGDPIGLPCGRETAAPPQPTA